MTAQLTNNAQSTLAVAVGTSDTSIVVQPGTGALFPALDAGNFFNITVITTQNTFEIMKCTTRVGDTLTVERAQEGTIAIPFPEGSMVDLRITVANIVGLVGSDDVLVL